MTRLSHSLTPQTQLRFYRQRAPNTRWHYSRNRPAWCTTDHAPTSFHRETRANGPRCDHTNRHTPPRHQNPNPDPIKPSPSPISSRKQSARHHFHFYRKSRCRFWHPPPPPDAHQTPTIPLPRAAPVPQQHHPSQTPPQAPPENISEHTCASARHHNPRATDATHPCDDCKNTSSWRNYFRWPHPHQEIPAYQDTVIAAW